MTNNYNATIVAKRSIFRSTKKILSEYERFGDVDRTNVSVSSSSVRFPLSAINLDVLLFHNKKDLYALYYYDKHDNWAAAITNDTYGNIFKYVVEVVVLYIGVVFIGAQEAPDTVPLTNDTDGNTFKYMVEVVDLNTGEVSTQFMSKAQTVDYVSDVISTAKVDAIGKNYVRRINSELMKDEPDIEFVNSNLTKLQKLWPNVVTELQINRIHIYKFKIK